MGDRLKGKVAVVVGAGQTPGDTIGNGRASAIVYAREGARVLLVDRRLESAEDTRAMIAKEGGEALAFQADVTHLEEAAWDRILSVNMKSVFLTCKHVIPVMRTQGGGAILNISSIAAVCSVGGLLAYKTSKAGVNAITHQLAIAN